VTKVTRPLQNPQRDPQGKARRRENQRKNQRQPNLLSSFAFSRISHSEPYSLKRHNR